MSDRHMREWARMITDRAATPTPSPDTTSAGDEVELPERLVRSAAHIANSTGMAYGEALEALRAATKLVTKSEADARAARAVEAERARVVAWVGGGRVMNVSRSAVIFSRAVRCRECGAEEQFHCFDATDSKLDVPHYGRISDAVLRFVREGIERGDHTRT